MTRATHLILLASMLTWTATVVSCSKDAATDSAAPANDSASDATQGAATDEAEQDAFAELPEAERVAAIAQRICPVTDEALGSMGTQIKVTVEGRDVYLCCEGCVEELKGDPAKYLAKLDAAASSAETPAADAPDASTDAEDADAAG
jgi:hypothetical protein